MLPEKTSIGTLSFKDIEKTKKEIMEYIIRFKDKLNLSYEYRYENKYVPIYITGRNSDEENLPIFKHPIVIMSNNVTYIVTNLRGIVYSDRVENTISDVKRNQLSVDIEIIRNVLLYSTLNNNSVNSSLVSMVGKPFALWVKSLLTNSFRLDPREMYTVEGVLYHYFISSNIPNVGIDKIKDKMVRYLSPIYRDRQFLDFVVDGLNNTPVNVHDLVDNLKVKVESGKLNNLSANILLPLVADSWNISDIGNELCVMSLESSETFIALVKESTTRLVSGKTKISKILEDNKRNYEKDNIDKVVEDILNNVTL